MTTTMTVANHDAFRVGDRIQVADQRRWWRKLLDWLLRRPRPIHEYVVTGCVGTVLTVEDASKLECALHDEEQPCPTCLALDASMKLRCDVQ